MEYAPDAILDLCRTESDAVALSIKLSRKTQRRVGELSGIDESKISRLARGLAGFTTDGESTRFMLACGNWLLSQYRKREVQSLALEIQEIEVSQRIA